MADGRPKSPIILDDKPFPDYKFLKLVGKGASGHIYKAIWKPYNKIVAVKVLNTEASKNQRARFLREVKAIARLMHPNIVQIFEVDISNACYYSMQYIEGQTLGPVIKSSEYSLREKVRFLEQVAKALHYAHGEGFMHRDVKPQNILVSKDGKPYLIDFGFAKNKHQDVLVTKDGTTVGTPLYMAPEQALGRQDMLGPQTDVYALGTILYQILTRRLPYRKKSMIEIIRAIVYETPAAPRTLDESVPEALEAVCMRAMEKSLQKRYSSAAAFADDLDLWVRGSSLEHLTANSDAELDEIDEEKRKQRKKKRKKSRRKRPREAPPSLWQRLRAYFFGARGD